MFGSHGAARVEGQAPHPSCGGQVRLARGTPLAGGGDGEGADTYPQKSQTQKIKNNLSNEFALSPIQLEHSGCMPSVRKFQN